MARSRSGRFAVLHLLTMLGVVAVAGILGVSVASDGQRVPAAGLLLVAFGAALNLLVIGANGGRMPADTRGRPRYDGYIPSPDHRGYVPMSSRTRLRYLGDWIGVGRSLLSPGDLCIFAGAVTAAVGRWLLKP